MATPLTPNSKIVKAITSHIESGIPINTENYNLSPDDMIRLEAVFALYKAWRENPMVNKQAFLRSRGRRSQDLPNDLYCFNIIKGLTTDVMLPKEDLLLLQQKAALDAYQAAKDLGDGMLLLKASKQIGDIIKNMPEHQEERKAELQDFYSSDIRDIAPDFIPVSSEQRRKLLAKYGGSPDKNTAMVEEKVERLRKQTAACSMPRLVLVTNTDSNNVPEMELPDMEEL